MDSIRRSSEALGIEPVMAMESARQRETSGKKRDPASSRISRLRAKLAGGYNYNVKNGYTYAFENSAATVKKVEVDKGHLRMPAGCTEFHAAFLKVNIKSTFTGIFIQPCVEIESGGNAEIQYFERGGRGTRYINLSSFLDEDAQDVSLRSKHLEVATGSAELVLFKNGSPSDPTVLVIAPHPDDAEVAAYGFYSDISNTYIITITPGDAGTYNYNRVFRDRREHYLKKGELRTWNSITVPMLCGIPPERTVNLGYFEGRLKEMYSDPEMNAVGLYSGASDINTYRRQNLSDLANELEGTANWTSLVANLTRLLMKIRPDIIVTPHPVLDIQEDHRFSSIALFEAAKAAGLQTGKIYMYANHYQHNHLIPYGPAGSGTPLPPVFSNDICFTSIYSHTLSENKQRDKVLSLEAMNDLRLHTNRVLSAESTRAALKAPLKSWLGYDDSYYRRAVRRQELFFVVDVKELDDEKTFALITGLELGRHG